MAAKLKRITVPPAGASVELMAPPCASTVFRQTARPMQQLWSLVAAALPEHRERVIAELGRDPRAIVLEGDGALAPQRTVSRTALRPWAEFLAIASRDKQAHAAGPRLAPPTSCETVARERQTSALRGRARPARLMP